MFDRTSGNDHRDYLILGEILCRGGHDILSAVQDRYAVSEIVNLVNVVADPDDLTSRRFLDVHHLTEAHRHSQCFGTIQNEVFSGQE